MENIVSADWLHHHLNDENLVILDASPEATATGGVSEYKGLHIPGSLLMDVKNDFSDPDNPLPNTLPSPALFEAQVRKLGIDDESKIVVYDNQGIYMSPRVWWMFTIMGHREIAVLDGGLPEWMRKGYTATNAPSFPGRIGDFTARFHPEWLTSMNDVRTNIESKDAVLIDARSKGRFQGSAPEPRADLPSGHIPDSLNIPYQDVLSEGCFKNTEELKKVFKDLLNSDMPLIFSCGSGVTACINLLAARQITDLPMSIYDGSWTEWASQPGNLIRTGKT